MNLGELRQRVRLLLQDPDPAGRFSDEALNTYINDALFTIADRLDVLQHDAETDWPLQGGGAQDESEAAAIRLPLDTLGVRIVRWNDRALAPTTQEQLDLLDPDWVTRKGTPVRYFTSGPNVVRLVPIPEEAGVVRIRYVRAPAKLMQDSDESELPDFLAMLAPHYAAYLAYVSEVGQEAKATHFLSLFEANLAQAKLRLARRESYPACFRIKAEVRR